MSRIPIIWSRKNRRVKRPKLIPTIPFSFPYRDLWMTEYRFHETRKWRFDFALLPLKIAVEVEGGIWKGYGRNDDPTERGGRHNRPQGYLGDMEKYNAAQALDWRVFRFTPQELEAGAASYFLKNFIEGQTDKIITGRSR